MTTILEDLPTLAYLNQWKFTPEKLRDEHDQFRLSGGENVCLLYDREAKEIMVRNIGGMRIYRQVISRRTWRDGSHSYEWSQVKHGYDDKNISEIYVIGRNYELEERDMYGNPRFSYAGFKLNDRLLDALRGVLGTRLKIYDNRPSDW